MSSNCFATVTAAVVEIASGGALSNMIQQLKSREIDVFASSYYCTRPFAHGVERSAHEEEIYVSKRNATIRGKLELSRAFDLVYGMYVVIDLPGIANRTGGAYATGADRPWYTNGVAAALINEMSISMGGHSLSALSGQAIYLFDELSGVAGKRVDALLGKADSVEELQDASFAARRLYVPGYFWWCSTRGSLSNALKLIASQFQRAHIDMSLNSLASVIENAGATNVPAGTISRNTADPTLELVISEAISNSEMLAPVRTGGQVDATGAAAAAATLLRGATNVARCTLDTLGITLDEEDRQATAAFNGMQLMNEIHRRDYTGTNRLKETEQIDITEFAKNLVYDIQIAARVTDDGAGMAWGPMRFDGIQDGERTYGPLAGIDVTISGQQRYPRGIEAEAFNAPMAFVHHSTLPSHTGIYTIPFSMFPGESEIADSHANASKLDSLVVTLKKQEALAARNVEAHVFCHSYNVLVSQRGMVARYFV